MSGKPNNAGIYNFDNLNAQTLYIKGKRFEDYINELVFEDQLEQDEITEIKLLLEYLDTTGLNSAWTVTNSNVNETLRSAITALQTKLANIDTTALTQSSVLNNDNRNSVLKTRLDTAATDITALTTRVTTAEGDIDSLETRMTTAEGDIDSLETRETNVENKTKYITTSTNATIPGISGTTPAYIKVQPFETNEPVRAIDLFVNPDELTDRGYLVAPVGRQTYMRMIGTAQLTSLTQPQYNKIEMQTNRFSLEANDIKITCNPLDLSLSLGEISVPGTIRIGAKSDTIEIGTEPPNPFFENKINIGVVGFPTKSITSLKGFLNVDGCEWVLPKSDKFGLDTLIAFIPTAGLPAWVLSFALGSSIPSFEYSDVFVMKDGATGVNKSGEVTTSNEAKLKSLVIFNRSLNIARLTPIEGTFVASGTISKTTLNGSIRNSCFLDGGGDNKIAFKHHNIAASDITEWATTEGNDKCNVFEIGGDSGILLHQGAANAGTDIKIINSKAGNIVLKVGTGGGIKANAKDSFTVLHDANQPGAAIGRLSTQASDTNETNRTNNPIARLEVECVPNRKGIRLFSYDPAQPFTMLPEETTINNQSVSTQSLVINGNYTGNTDARLYKNADNKLMWNGAEVGAGGVSSGGITYMINVPTNITNPNPTPTETIMTAAYSGNAQRTITQAVTANTAYYIAKYTTEVFDEASNPVLTGLQQLNQYLVWSSNSHTGQIYGLLWFQATAIGLGVLYQRTYASPVTTTPATLINGTPIPTPKGQYSIRFQRVVFPNINVVVSSGPVVLRHRVEGLVSGSWSALYTTATGQSVASSTNNLTVTLDETITLLNSTPGATALRLVLFIVSGTGTISQTSAGGADLGAYSLIALGSNTPGLFRTLLHDGTNAKVITPHTTTPTLIEYDLPIDAPYNVSAFPSPTLSTDLYFVQPTGGFANHAITLYFNDGSLSHYHSTITPPQVTPTLAQVLNSGATASQPINMNSNKISGITTLEGAANGNWNVKEITAGTGVSVTPTNGNYAIANTGVLSVAAASGTPNISVSTTNGAVTLQNTAPVQDVVASTGISIGYNATTKTSTIYNDAAVQNLTAGTGISISTDPATRIAVITNTNVGATQVGVAGTIRDEHQSLYEVGALPRKPDYWATNWSVADSTVRSHRDIYVSVDGKIIASAPGAFTIRYSTDYGTTWNNATGLPTATTWTSICGTSSGSRLFVFGTFTAPNLVQSLVLYTSYNQGASWTQITSSAFTGITTVNRVRCSGDATYILASDDSLVEDARVLYSNNGGTTWARQLIGDLPSGKTKGVAMSRSGAIQFATWINSAENSSRVLRSNDYGATWTERFGHISGANWTHIECDAMGRYVWATRFLNVNTQDSQAWYSDDYGVAWYQGGINSIEDIWVSGTGQFVCGISVPNTSLVNNRFAVYSSDYGRTFQIHAVSNTTLLRTINGSADGSVLVIGSTNQSEGGFASDGLLRIAREGQQNIQDLSVLGGTLSKLNGVYTLTNDVVLWSSGQTTISTATAFVNFDFSSINLDLYNIRYEIDCYWNLSVSTAAFITMSLNNFASIDSYNNTFFTGSDIGAITNWTNNIHNGTYGSTGVFDQGYRNRFYCGYSPTVGETAQFRYRTIMRGELSLQYRPQAQAGITDTSTTERTIYNRFSCENYTTSFVGGLNLIYGANSNNIDSNHQRINGTAVWGAHINWNSNGTFSNGITQIGIRMLDGADLTTKPRTALYVTKFFRVRK
jgi:hypothetical protein